MHRSFGLAIFAAAAVLGAASSAQAVTMLDVSASNLCGEDGCFSDTQRTFTRTWSAAQMSGPLSISQIAIDKALLGSMQDYAVRVSFVDSEGNTVSTWGSYTLAVLSGQVVTLGGQTVNWDMANGDLTLKLELMIPDKGGLGGGFGGGGGGFGGGFAASNGRAAFTPGVDVAASLPQVPAAIVGNLPAALAVPEPGAWALMLTGFLGAGTMLRSRRRRALPGV